MSHYRADGTCRCHHSSANPSIGQQLRCRFCFSFPVKTQGLNLIAFDNFYMVGKLLSLRQWLRVCVCLFETRGYVVYYLICKGSSIACKYDPGRIIWQ
jgi:hypothetical protein